MVLIAVDPHKLSHTAMAVDEQGHELETLRVTAQEEEGCGAGPGSGASVAGRWREHVAWGTAWRSAWSVAGSWCWTCRPRW